MHGQVAVKCAQRTAQRGVGWRGREERFDGAGRVRRGSRGLRVPVPPVLLPTPLRGKGEGGELVICGSCCIFRVEWHGANSPRRAVESLRTCSESEKSEKPRYVLAGGARLTR